MRSFSNLWFWIVLAVMWSSASHWVLGVPYDMVTRARYRQGQAQADLEGLARINANRVLNIATEAGLFLSAFVAALLTMLAILAFYYRVEFAQALFLLLFPMTIVGLLSIATARRILLGEGEGDALYRRLRIQRIWTQVVGMISVFVTALWGMFVNLATFQLTG